jgi:phage-related protein
VSKENDGPNRPGIYRVIYTARLPEAVIVLHAFEKKTQRTSKRDIELAKGRLSELMKDRR